MDHTLPTRAREAATPSGRGAVLQHDAELGLLVGRVLRHELRGPRVAVPVGVQRPRAGLRRGERGGA